MSTLQNPKICNFYDEVCVENYKPVPFKNLLVMKWVKEITYLIRPDKSLGKL